MLFRLIKRLLGFGPDPSTKRSAPAERIATGAVAEGLERRSDAQPEASAPVELPKLPVPPKPIGQPEPTPRSVPHARTIFPAPADSRPEQQKLTPPDAPLRPSPPAPSKPDLHTSVGLPTRDLYIGFDLGTSCTKVVVHDPIEGRFYAVPFSQGKPGIDRFLLRTCIWEADGHVGVEPFGGATKHSNLKMRLMEADNDSGSLGEAIEDAALYVAWVLRYAISWFLKQHGSSVRGRQPCWWLVVGLPDTKVVDQSLHRRYKALTYAACRALDSHKPLTRGLIRELLAADPGRDTKGSAPLLGTARVSFYPEIGAQLAGYVSSPHARMGPLMLVDVGAGTLDVSTLILHAQGGEEICSFHFCCVKPLGAFRLHQRRVGRLTPLLQAHQISLPPELDPFQPVPGSLRELLPSVPNPPRALLAEFSGVDEEFVSECRHCCHERVHRFIRGLREFTSRPANDPLARRKSFPYILVGGGSRLQAYRALVGVELESMLNGIARWHLDPYSRLSAGEGFKRADLCVPDGLIAPGVSKPDFDRLSVAHGLSLGQQNLMRITVTG